MQRKHWWVHISPHIKIVALQYTLYKKNPETFWTMYIIRLPCSAQILNSVGKTTMFQKPHVLHKPGFPLYMRPGMMLGKTQISSTNVLLTAHLHPSCWYFWGIHQSPHGYFSLPEMFLCSHGHFHLPSPGESSDVNKETSTRTNRKWFNYTDFHPLLLKWNASTLVLFSKQLMGQRIVFPGSTFWFPLAVFKKKEEGLNL